MAEASQVCPKMGLKEDEDVRKQEEDRVNKHVDAKMGVSSQAAEKYSQFTVRVQNIPTDAVISLFCLIKTPRLIFN